MQAKRHIRLENGTTVPEMDRALNLPIETFCPHKYAMIDMAGGGIYLIDPARSANADVWLKTLTRADLLALRRIVNRRLKDIVPKGE